MAARKIVASAALGFALLAALLLPARVSTASPGAPTMEDVRGEAARGGYRLIDLAALRALLDREPGRALLVDTRQDWEYRTGHLPGAVNFPFEPTAWSRLKNRWALGRALGADTGRPIVFY